MCVSSQIHSNHLLKLEKVCVCVCGVCVCVCKHYVRESLGLLGREAPEKGSAGGREGVRDAEVSSAHLSGHISTKITRELRQAKCRVNIWRYS